MRPIVFAFVACLALTLAAVPAHAATTTVRTFTLEVSGTILGVAAGWARDVVNINYDFDGTNYTSLSATWTCSTSGSPWTISSCDAPIMDPSSDDTFVYPTFHWGGFGGGQVTATIEALGGTTGYAYNAGCTVTGATAPPPGGQLHFSCTPSP